MLCSKPVELGHAKPAQNHRDQPNAANSVSKAEGDFSKSFGIQDSEYIDLVQRLSQHLHSIADRGSPQRLHSPARSSVNTIHRISTTNEVCPTPSISTKGACQASCQASTNKRTSRRILKSDRKLLRRSVSQRPKSNSSVQLPSYQPFATEGDDGSDTSKVRDTDSTSTQKASDRTFIAPLTPRPPTHDATELFYALKTKSISRKHRASIGNVKVIRVSLPEETNTKQQLRLIQSMRSLQALASKQQKDHLTRERLLERAKSKTSLSASQPAAPEGGTSLPKIKLDDKLDEIRLKDLPPLPEHGQSHEPQFDPTSFAARDSAIAEGLKQDNTTDQGHASGGRPHRKQSRNAPVATTSNGFFSATDVLDIHPTVDLDRYSLPPLQDRSAVRCNVRNTRKANSHPSAHTQPRPAATYISRTSKGAIFNLGPPSAPPERPLPEIPKGIPASFRKGSLCGNVLHVSDVATLKNPKLSPQRVQRLSADFSKSSTRTLANMIASNDQKTCPTPADIFQNKLKRNARISELKRKHLLLYNRRFITDTTAPNPKRTSLSTSTVLTADGATATSDLPKVDSQTLPSNDIPRSTSLSQSTDHGSGVSIRSSRVSGSEADTGGSVHSSLAQRSGKSCASSPSTPSPAATVSARASVTRQVLTTSQIMTIAETDPDTSYGFQCGTLDAGASHRKSVIKDEGSGKHSGFVEDVSSPRGRSNSGGIISRSSQTHNANHETNRPLATGTPTIKANMGTSISRHTEQDYQDVLSSHQQLEKRLALARKELEWMGRIYPVMVSACERNRGGKVDHNGDDNDVSLPSTFLQQRVADTGRSRYRITKRQQEQSSAKPTPTTAESTQKSKLKHNEEPDVPKKRISGTTESKTPPRNDWHIFPETYPSPTRSRKVETSPKRIITRDSCTGLRKSSGIKVRVPRPSPVRNPPFTHGYPNNIASNNEHDSDVVITKRSSGDASMHERGRLLPPLKYNFSGTGRLRFDFTSFAFD